MFFSQKSFGNDSFGGKRSPRQTVVSVVNIPKLTDPVLTSNGSVDSMPMLDTEIHVSVLNSSPDDQEKVSSPKMKYNYFKNDAMSKQ